MEKKMRDKTNEVELNEQELRLIQLIRELGYGQIVLSVRGGVPTHVEEIRKSVPLK